MTQIDARNITWDLGRDITYEVLIENLGGYETAKSKLRDNGSLHAERLKKALLEYRRQHKFYEPNDLVVFVDEKERKPVLLKFKESRNFDLVHLEVIGSGLCGPSYQKEIRHATDAEIKAGKRLEVK